MSPLFTKLNLGTHAVIHVLGAPPSFEPELAALVGIAVKRRVDGPCRFAVAFVVTQAELDGASTSLAAHSVGDAIVWIAYPKASSARYRCEFNRDSGWPALGAAGFEPVRIVAIDDDWSALRFRKVEHIRSMTRRASGAISAEGRRKTSSGGR